MSEPVVEHVALAITPGRELDFENAFSVGMDAVRKARGYRGARLMRQAEDPTRYVLLIVWDTLESHMVEFRNSDLFERWRGAVGQYFDQPPVMAHYILGHFDGEGTLSTWS